MNVNARIYALISQGAKKKVSSKRDAWRAMPGYRPELEQHLATGLARGVLELLIEDHYAGYAPVPVDLLEHVERAYLLLCDEEVEEQQPAGVPHPGNG